MPLRIHPTWWHQTTANIAICLHASRTISMRPIAPKQWQTTNRDYRNNNNHDGHVKRAQMMFNYCLGPRYLFLLVLIFCLLTMFFLGPINHSPPVTVRARLHSFWRTITGWLWWSLWWWPPHHAPHMFHVVGQSYRAHTSSWGHGFRSPQGLAVTTSTDSVFTDVISNSRWTSFKFVHLFRL